MNILIPAYKPDDRLIQLTRELKEEKLDVLLVDDGGQKPFAPIFEQCRALGAEIAVHAVNQGKGRALKTGLNAALNIWPDLSGVVTAYADGQHTLRGCAVQEPLGQPDHPLCVCAGQRCACFGYADRSARLARMRHSRDDHHRRRTV